MRIDPLKDPELLLSDHPTYQNELPAVAVGKSQYMAPLNLAYPRTMAYTTQDIARQGKKIIPINHARMMGFRELMDQQYVDQMGQYEQQMKKKLGYAEGGAVVFDPALIDRIAQGTSWTHA
jgi:hypothetical protein